MFSAHATIFVRSGGMAFRRPVKNVPLQSDRAATRQENVSMAICSSEHAYGRKGDGGRPATDDPSASAGGDDWPMMRAWSGAGGATTPMIIPSTQYSYDSSHMIQASSCRVS
jgi:hypothetical protein